MGHLLLLLVLVLPQALMLLAWVPSHVRLRSAERQILPDMTLSHLGTAEPAGKYGQQTVSFHTAGLRRVVCKAGLQFAHVDMPQERQCQQAHRVRLPGM